MTIRNIPINFTLPTDYHRRFIFGSSRFRLELRFDGPDGLEIVEDGECGNALVQSRCLDWITESIMSVRSEGGEV